jgi:hypothetical protein
MARLRYEATLIEQGFEARAKGLSCLLHPCFGLAERRLRLLSEKRVYFLTNAVLNFRTGPSVDPGLG